MGTESEGGKTEKIEPEKPLEYASPQSPPKVLALEEFDGGVRVIFPVRSRRSVQIDIAYFFALGFFSLALRPAVHLLIWQSFRHSGFATAPPTFKELWSDDHPAETYFGIAAVWGMAGYSFWKLRRWGQPPRILVVDRDGISYSRFAFLNMRTRYLPVIELKSVTLRKLRGNMSWKRFGFNICFDRVRGGCADYRLLSPDKDLPEHIARRIAEVTGLPLKLI